MSRIFQIGFNRCGTTSFYNFFKKNRIPSLHWNRGSIAAGIKAAHLSNKPLLSLVEGFTFYSDMEYVDIIHAGEWISELQFQELFKQQNRDDFLPIYGYEMFAELDKQYPNSKFILNTRDVDNWINSRLRFLKSGYEYCKHGHSFHDNEEELKLCWKEHWHTHYNSVIDYFKDRPHDLLIFNIESDDPVKIVDFFANLELKIEHWGHHNKSRGNQGDFSKAEWVDYQID